MTPWTRYGLILDGGADFVLTPRPEYLPMLQYTALLAVPDRTRPVARAERPAADHPWRQSGQTRTQLVDPQQRPRLIG